MKYDYTKTTYPKNNNVNEETAFALLIRLTFEKHLIKGEAMFFSCLHLSVFTFLLTGWNSDRGTVFASFTLVERDQLLLMSSILYTQDIFNQINMFL